MRDSEEPPPRKTRSKNVFPCGVHSQHNAARGAAVTDTETSQIHARHDGAGSPTFEDDSPTKLAPLKKEYFRIESDGDGGDVSARSAPARPEAQRGEPSWTRSSTDPCLPPVPCEGVLGEGPRDPSPGRGPSRPSDPASTDVRRVSEDSRVSSACESIPRGTRIYKTCLKYLVQSYSHKAPGRDKYLDSRSKNDPPEHAPEINKGLSINNDLPLPTCIGDVSLNLDCSGPIQVNRDVSGHSIPTIPLSAGNILARPSSRICTILDHKLKHSSDCQGLRSPHLEGVGDLNPEDVFNDQNYRIGINEKGEGQDSPEEPSDELSARRPLASTGSCTPRLFRDHQRLRMVICCGTFLSFLLLCKLFVLDEKELGFVSEGAGDVIGV